MSLNAIHAFLVKPGKGKPTLNAISGKSLPLAGKLYDVLWSIFCAEPDKRDFEITFKPSATGSQRNDCRDCMIAYAVQPDLATGQAVATRLMSVTDNRSGTGLLFLMSGQFGSKTRLVASRFPTDQAILAEVDNDNLKLEFLEQVFIKRMTAYKAVMLEHQNPSSSNGFWSGVCTDRQAGGSAENISDYWLEDFLQADFSETPAQGTKRLAVALREAAKANPNLIVKSEIAHAASLAANVFKNKKTSIRDFCEHFGFSQGTIDSIEAKLSKSSLMDKKFLFDDSEFKSKVPYRTVEIENGAMLTARSEDFESVFKKTLKDDGIVEFLTEGRVSDERMSQK